MPSRRHSRVGRRTAHSEAPGTAKPATAVPPSCACGDAGAACVLEALGVSSCKNEPTDASESLWAGTHCLLLRRAAMRGIWIISRTVSQSIACTGGDSYHATAVNDGLRFAALSRPVVGSATPSVYWVNLSSSALNLSPQRYELSIALVETQRRSDKPGAAADVFDLSEWLRSSQCVWRHVTKAASIDVAETRRARPTEPLCRGPLPPDGAAAGYLRLADPLSCDGGAACDGDAAVALLNTSSDARYHRRMAKGYQHVLKPLGCRLRLYEEADVARCLAGRKVLNMGSDVAVDLQRGFARLNSSTRAWSRRKPGSMAEQRKRFSERLPSAADFAYQFERTGGFNGRGPDVLPGLSYFGAASVGTQYLQHPPHYGLANMLEPEGVSQARGRVGFRTAKEYQRWMCHHDLVILESGLADFGLPFSEFHSWAKNSVRPKCTGASSADCEAALAPALLGEDWRRLPMRAYTRRLEALLSMWRQCRRAKPAFRAIFKLAPAPRSRQRPNDCELAQWCAPWFGTHEGCRSPTALKLRAHAACVHAPPHARPLSFQSLSFRP